MLGFFFDVAALAKLIFRFPFLYFRTITNVSHDENLDSQTEIQTQEPVETEEGPDTSTPLRIQNRGVNRVPGKRRSKTDDIDVKLMTYLEKKTNEEDDGDRNFLLSLLPYFQGMSAQKKLQIRMKMMRLFDDENERVITQMPPQQLLNETPTFTELLSQPYNSY